jgi:hypothetical protein
MRPLPCLALLLAAGALLPGCKKKQTLQEDLKTVVQEDRRIAKEEDELLTRRGSLQRERGQLRDKRAELLTKKLTLDDADQAGKTEIEKEEAKLVGLEASLVKEETTLNKKLQNLFDEKIDKIAKEGSAKDVLIARRELGVATREKDLARREGELARREKAIAAREQVVAERQARLCPRGTTVVQTFAPPPSGGGGSYGRKDVEPLYKSALAAMQSKGILTADLPAGTDRLVTEIRHGVSKGDFARAKYAADQLLATVRGMKIDRGFIGAKIGRLGAAIRHAPPRADRKAKVNTLFQQATASYGDGRFLDANQKLNKIYALLQ